jgi:peptide/nickel transport system substrate-binding protein
MNKIIKNFKKIIFFIIIILIISISTGCINDSNNNQKEILTIGFMKADSIYPYSINTFNRYFLFSNIFNSLVEFDESFNIIPALAESWNNPDALTWRFFLRKGVKFHNGENFTSEDVKYSLNFTINNIYISFIKDVKIINNHTIDIITFEPYPGLLQRLAHIFLVIPNNYDYEKEMGKPIGTGPYRFVDYDENNYTKLEIFEDYWGETPKINTVIYKIIENQQERINHLLSGNIDIAEYNIDENIEKLKNESSIKIKKYPPLATYIIGFDFRENNSYGFSDGNNPTADIRVRKAIYHAIDIDPLIKGPFKGYATPASQLLTPYIFGYNPDIKRLTYNVSLAKELLIEAGYGDGFQIELDCITVDYDYNNLNCELIKEQLSKIGVEVKLNKLSIDEFNKKVVYNQNTSLWIVGWGTVSSDGGDVYNSFLMSRTENLTGFYNSGYYSNPKVDAIGLEVSIEMNSKKRSELLQEGFRIAHLDDIFVIPLFSQELLILTSNNIDIIPRADERIIIKDIKFL